MNHDPISRAMPGGAATDRRTGVGNLLRASRLRCGEELDVIAQVLRIRRRHLQAIEDGNFDLLPGAAYAVGFIRAYADYLGLDSDEVVRRFKDEQTLQTGKPPKADLIFPSPMSESGIPRGAIVFLGALIGVIAYGAWYTSAVDNDFFERWIEPVPARLAALLPSEARNDGPDRSQAVAGDKFAASVPAPEPAAVPAPEPAAVPAPEPAAVPASALDAAGEPAPQATSRTEPAAVPAGEPSDAAPTPEPAASAEVPAAAEPVRPPESIAQPVETTHLPAPQAADAAPVSAATEVASTPIETSEARIVLTAVSDSWVEVREQVTDAWIWGKLLRTGESYAVPDRPDLKMKTGNAGGLTIAVDGASVPPVGASGEVVRNVLLDPERLKAGTAVFR